DREAPGSNPGPPTKIRIRRWLHGWCARGAGSQPYHKLRPVSIEEAIPVLRDTSPAAANVTTPTWLAILLSCSSSRTARARVQASILSATALAGPLDFLARAERTHRAGQIARSQCR